MPQLRPLSFLTHSCSLISLPCSETNLLSRILASLSNCLLLSSVQGSEQVSLLAH